MSDVLVPRCAVERNAAWIAAVETAVAGLDDPAKVKEILGAGGRPCARQILQDCAQILGRYPQSVDELIDATNQRRQALLGLGTRWERRGTAARLKLEACNCTLVRAGLARPNPTHCLCTVGLFEELFASVCQGPVVVEVLSTVGWGDACCEFVVEFEE
jgi:hypothetical protein